MSKTPLSVSKLTAAIKTGSRVTRGADWKGDDQDGPPPGDGTIIGERTNEWITILSDTGYHKRNRLGGFSGRYGPKVVDSLAVQQQSSFFESVKQNGNTVRVKCSYCKRAFVEDCLSSHELKCLDRPIRCPTCNVVVALRMWFDHECQTVRMKATEKLVDDLAELIQKDEFSDITVKVKEKEFKLHRSILAGRNSYFNSLFKNERKKKNTTGIVSIDDCDSDTFYSFIYFMYTGQIRKLLEENVCALYEAASKYQEQQLKAECLCFMKNKISVDSCCDFLVLALKHDKKELFKSATDFFCKKTNDIIKTIKWQTFIKEYSIIANDLFIKSFEFNAK